MSTNSGSSESANTDSKIVVLGGLNMDLMIETPRPAGPGETTEGTRFYTAPGGKGGNQSVAAARLSREKGSVAMVGRVGNDLFGNEMREFLENEGINTTYLAEDNETASGIAAIFIDNTGENYVNAVYGANARCNEEQVQAVELRLDGEQVARLEAAPWRARVELGEHLRPRLLEAVAFGEEGELHRVQQVLNLGVDRAQLRISLGPSRADG